MLSNLYNQTFGDQSYPLLGICHVQTCLQPFIKGITPQPSDQDENAGGWMFFYFKIWYYKNDFLVCRYHYLMNVFEYHA